MSEGELLTQEEIDALLRESDSYGGGGDDEAAGSPEELIRLAEALVRPGLVALEERVGAEVTLGDGEARLVNGEELVTVLDSGPALVIDAGGPWKSRFFACLSSAAGLALIGAEDAAGADRALAAEERHRLAECWGDLLAALPGNPEAGLGEDLTLAVATVEEDIEDAQGWFGPDAVVAVVRYPLQVGEVEGSLTFCAALTDFQDGAEALLGGPGQSEVEPEPVDPEVAEVPPDHGGVKTAEYPELTTGMAGGRDSRIDMLMDIPLELSVELGRTKQRVRDVLALGSGSVVELDRLAGEDVDVRVNGRLVARGQVVVIDENFGIRITDIVSAAERLRKLG